MFVGSLGEDRGKRSEESFGCSQFGCLLVRQHAPGSIPAFTSPLTNKESRCTFLSGKTDPITGRRKRGPYSQPQPYSKALPFLGVMPTQPTATGGVFSLCT